MARKEYSHASPLPPDEIQFGYYGQLKSDYIRKDLISGRANSEEEIKNAFDKWHKDHIELLHINQKVLEAGEYYLLLEAFAAGAKMVADIVLSDLDN